MISLFVIVVLSYLVGSIPGSVLIAKYFYRVNIREHGSGNPGATNVFRVLGWKAGVICTLIDMGKGLLAAGLIATIRIDGLPYLFDAWQMDTVIRLLAGIAAVAGHMFPVWAGFHGGKGVNTSGGALFAIEPISMLITLAAFAIVLLATRYVSLASMAAAIAFPSSVAIRRYLFGVESIDPSLVVLSILMAVGLFVAHRPNILRLMRGKENRVRSFRPARGSISESRVS
jgi:acyl phosphate:glycerol-3-phosphate acyltransferase